MAKPIDKRKKIFDAYTTQLRKLNQNGLLPEGFNYKEGEYICPICLNPFTEEDLKTHRQIY
ncbi:MAG: hypothetical protein PHS04_08780 [Tissierellia bacterium]|nr:hypothetical protein [Tissierellia bacterium]